MPLVGGHGTVIDSCRVDLSGSAACVHLIASTTSRAKTVPSYE